MIKKFNNIKKTKRFQKGGAARPHHLAPLSARNTRNTRNTRKTLSPYSLLPPIGTERNSHVPEKTNRRNTMYVTNTPLTNSYLRTRTRKSSRKSVKLNNNSIPYTTFLYNLYKAFAKLDNTATRQDIKIPTIKGKQPTYAYVMPIMGILYRNKVIRANNEDNNSQPNRYMLNITHDKINKVYNNTSTNKKIADYMVVNSITIIANTITLDKIQRECREFLQNVGQRNNTHKLTYNTHANVQILSFFIVLSFLLFI